MDAIIQTFARWHDQLCRFSSIFSCSPSCELELSVVSAIKGNANDAISGGDAEKWRYYLC